MKYVPAIGPKRADILIVGEAPGEREEEQGTPFVGGSGQLLSELLKEVGISRSLCRITNVCHYRPPRNDISKFFLTKTAARKVAIRELNGKYPNKYISDGLRELEDEIASCQPKVIIALGNTALWALTGDWGITKWRGSRLYYKSSNIPIIPTYHPAAIIRLWELRPIALHDLTLAPKILANTAPKPPDYTFTVRPTFEECVKQLCYFQRGQPIAVDIETYSQHIICIALAWNSTDAICIPFLNERKEPYFNLKEEMLILTFLRLTLRTCNIIGQLFNFDSQMIKHYWGVTPNLHGDTYIQQSVFLPGHPRGLDYLSSMYTSYHVYWKDDLKAWKNYPSDMDTLWNYNCKDAVVTYEVWENQIEAINKAKLTEQYQEQLEISKGVLEMNSYGVNIKDERRQEALLKTLPMMTQRMNFLEKCGEALGIPKKKTPWYTSPIQQMQFFYDNLGLPAQYKRGTTSRTFSDAALEVLKVKEPILTKLFETIQELRSLNTFMSTFITSKLDWDRRFRTQCFSPGAETLRLTSQKSIWDTGGNIQNIPSGKED